MKQKALSKALVRAWYVWQHSPEPVSSFRHRRIDAPTYGIEHDLDHLASNVYSLGSAAIGRETCDYHQRASEELAEIDRISAELDSCAIPETEKSKLAEYISVTRSLLQELKRL
jgi:hypothetical protein